MDRRGIGLLVVVLALIAAVIVPRVIGPGITGAAQAVPVPGPPKVGDCVTASFDPTPMVTSSTDSMISYPDLTLGPCSGSRYGEVAALIVHPAGVIYPTDDDGNRSIDDPNEYGTCFPAAQRYVGLPTAGLAPTTVNKFWWLTARSEDLLSQPSPRQRAAGQEWLACIVYLRSIDADGGMHAVAARGSLKGAISTGTGRDYLGVCPATDDWMENTGGDCLAPHVGELFAAGAVTDAPVARVELESTCTSVIAKATGMADVTAGGRLAARMLVTDMAGHPLLDRTIPAGSPIMCGLLAVGGKALRGSLLSIGNGGIPWA